MWKELFTVASIILSTVKHGHCVVERAEDVFFLGGKKPTNLGEDDTMILQTDGTTEDVGYFATMYSKDKNGPLWSAYIVTPDNAKLMNKTKCPKDEDWREYDKKDEKAVYANNADDYTPGQLDPCSKNTFSANAVKATFTYSNAVPQAQGANWGASFQNGLVELESCGEQKSTLYFLTGVADFVYTVDAVTKVKTEEIESKDGQKKLAVSASVWTAVCCFGTEKDYQSPPSLAFIVSNKKPVKGEPEIHKIGLGKLQKLLGDVKLFPGDTESQCMTEEDLQA